jgi:hypothetical protein
MVNNFEQIRELLSFNSEDEFYFAQVLQRKKENSHLGSNSHVVKTYYIPSRENLDRDFPEMKCLADFHNARVYINLNKRSFEKTAFHTLQKITDIIMNKDYKQARKAYNSVCGMYAGGDKYWIVDIDSKEQQVIVPIINDIKNCRPDRRKFKHIAQVETKNGIHLITTPFDLSEFKPLHPDIEIHKNNPTLLYCP